MEIRFSGGEFEVMLQEAIERELSDIVNASNIRLIHNGNVGAKENDPKDFSIIAEIEPK